MPDTTPSRWCRPRADRGRGATTTGTPPSVRGNAFPRPEGDPSSSRLGRVTAGRQGAGFPAGFPSLPEPPELPPLPPRPPGNEGSPEPPVPEPPPEPPPGSPDGPPPWVPEEPWSWVPEEPWLWVPEEPWS